jgi:hypothetical protein
MIWRVHQIHAGKRTRAEPDLRSLRTLLNDHESKNEHDPRGFQFGTITRRTIARMCRLMGVFSGAAIALCSLPCDTASDIHEPAEIRISRPQSCSDGDQWSLWIAASLSFAGALFADRQAGDRLRAPALIRQDAGAKLRCAGMHYGHYFTVSTRGAL